MYMAMFDMPQITQGGIREGRNFFTIHWGNRLLLIFIWIITNVTLKSTYLHFKKIIVLALLYEYEGIFLVPFLNTDPFRATFGKTKEMNSNIFVTISWVAYIYFLRIQLNKHLSKSICLHVVETQMDFNAN